jgi:N-acetylmuramoyl-L-alanine amidase
VVTEEPQDHEHPAGPVVAPETLAASSQIIESASVYPDTKQAAQEDVYPSQTVGSTTAPPSTAPPVPPSVPPPVYLPPVEEQRPATATPPISRGAEKQPVETGTESSPKPKTGLFILIALFALIGFSVVATVGYFTLKRFLPSHKTTKIAQNEENQSGVNGGSTRQQPDLETPPDKNGPVERNRGIIVPPDPGKKPGPTSKPGGTIKVTPVKPAKDELLPESRTRNLTDADLKGKSAWDLTLIRNEIYARHGYIFKRAELSNHFKKRSWYKPVTGDQDRVWRLMSDIERRNVEFIQEYQNRSGLKSERPPAQEFPFRNRIQIASANPLFIPRSPSPQKQESQPAPPFPAPASSTRRKQPVICIDPGHPSEVGIGTRGKKVTEVGIAWEVSLKIKKILEEEGWTVVLTKSREREFVRNRDRAMVANRANADLMVRLHCDSTGGSGTATFYPDRQGFKQGVRGPQRYVIQRSREMATVFHRAMMQSLKGSLRDRGLSPDMKTLIGSRQGALTGSIFSRVPVLLVEMCVLTHPADEAFIATEAGQMKMANAIADGIRAAIRLSTTSGK